MVFHSRRRLWMLAGLLALDVLLWYGAFAWRGHAFLPPLAVAIGISPGSETLILARNQGMLPDSRINIVEMNWSSAAMRALGNHAVDAAVLSLDELLRLRESGQDVRVALVLDISKGADALMARPEYKDIAALRGKRIGVEMRAVGMSLLNRALENAGMVMADVQVVPLNLAETDTAYLDDHLDAVVTAEPWLTKLRTTGAVNLFDSTQMEHQLCHVLAVQHDSMDRFADEIRLLVSQHFLWRERLLASSNVAGLDAICRREELSVDAFKAALQHLHLPDADENARLLGGAHPELLATTSQLSAFMLKGRLLETAPALSNMLAPQFLQNPQ